MTVKEIISKFRLGVLKPGYPTGRGQYLVLDSDKERAHAVLSAHGYTVKPLVGVGPDRNNGGELYLISKKKDRCCICGGPLEGFGNNPYPLAEKGRCCDACNTKVVAARIAAMRKGGRQ